MSRKKKEESVSFKDGKDKAVYKLRYDGVTGRMPSRRKSAVRDSWLPEAMPKEAIFYGSDDELELSPEELNLLREISNARR